MRVAKCGLTLQQRDVPSLDELAKLWFRVAGPDATKSGRSPYRTRRPATVRERLRPAGEVRPTVSVTERAWSSLNGDRRLGKSKSGVVSRPIRYSLEGRCVLAGWPRKRRPRSAALAGLRFAVPFLPPVIAARQYVGSRIGNTRASCYKGGAYSHVKEDKASGDVYQVTHQTE